MEDPTRIRPPEPDDAGPDVAALVFVEGEGVLGLRLPLGAELVLGRDPACTFPLPAADVSRRHARVVAEPGGHVLEDLGSTNGTYVNGERIERRRLAPGDRVRVGAFLARYVAPGDAAARDLETLARLALRDPLTGLANRRAFDDALAREVARAAAEGTPLAVVVLDLDHFKRVNDEHGHAAGDAVLAEVAARAQAALRAGDLLARIGGEELAAVLPRATLAAAAEVAERIRARVAGAPMPFGGGAVRVTASLGCAELGRGDATPAALLSRADARLYDAKAAGRDRVRT